MSTRIQRRLTKKQNAKRPQKLEKVPQHEWPHHPLKLHEVWCSREFLVQVYAEKNAMRLTVNRVTPTAESWEENITWDELQEIKRQIGYGEYQAVEIYPPDSEIVNVANMRHLWILDIPIDCTLQS